MANPFLKGQIVSEQPRKGVLGAHLNTFMSVVSDLGYSPTTIKTQLTLLKGFIRWAEENHIVASNIDEGITDRFLIESDRKGAVRRGDNKTLHRFLDHLRLEAAIPHLNPTPKRPVRKFPANGAWSINGNRVAILALYSKIHF
jgi:hypothetical protein